METLLLARSPTPWLVVGRGGPTLRASAGLLGECCGAASALAALGLLTGLRERLGEPERPRGDFWRSGSSEGELLLEPAGAKSRDEVCGRDGRLRRSRVLGACNTGVDVDR